MSKDICEDMRYIPRNDASLGHIEQFYFGNKVSYAIPTLLIGFVSF